MKEQKMIEAEKPVYFYRVSKFMTTFSMDKDKSEPYLHNEDFLP